MNLYEAEDSDVPNRSASAQHAFGLDRETRRMVCAKCGGKMNECPPYCSGKPSSVLR